MPIENPHSRSESTETSEQRMLGHIDFTYVGMDADTEEDIKREFNERSTEELIGLCRICKQRNTPVHVVIQDHGSNLRMVISVAGKPVIDDWRGPLDASKIGSWVKPLTEKLKIYLASNQVPEQPTNVEIPDGLERIGESEQGKQWIAYQRTLAENTMNNAEKDRLIDTSTFMTDATRNALHQYVGEQGNGMKFAETNKNGHQFAIETDSRQTWYVSESPSYKDQYPNGIPFAKTDLCIRKEGSNSLVQNYFKANTVFDGGVVQFDEIRRLMQEAQANFDSEENDPAGISRLDLPSTPIGYIGLVDGNRTDPVIRGLASDVQHFPEMMNSLKDHSGKPRYTFVRNEGSDFLVVRDDPMKLLDEQIDGFHRKGIRHIYINMAGHGNSQGVYFEIDGEHVPLRPAQLHDLFTKYSDCKSTVSTVACHGGGFADEMKNYRDETGQNGRIALLLQTKGYGLNQEGRVQGVKGQNGAPKVFSSYYNIFFAHYIQKYPLGKAHLLADKIAKQYIPSDAEAWVSGPQGGTATKNINER